MPTGREKRMASAVAQITGLLERWRRGDDAARDELIPLMYDQLRELAHRQLGRAPGERSLNTTGLVHEAYLRLASVRSPNLPDQGRFLALATAIMRHLLVDRARARLAAKRGGDHTRVPLEEALLVSDENSEMTAELDDALNRLEQFSPRQGQVLQHHFFGGLSLEESAAALDISVATVKRELRSARAWLALELRGESLR